ncbi:15050_t:CDS:2 [Dentiscutata erythropus]|uniref:15050_t:CDS:1 n=1 Tax=Dentiscutata erythropus TaxID=1348616 RepID=A0A9N8ZRQ7_9GLOM|nr:15050_t:CDS:2 [Dentiscutata erythropus]
MSQYKEQAKEKINEVKEDVKSSTPSVDPPPNSSNAEKAGGSITTVSSHFDPYPHYFMSFATLLGGGYAFQCLRQPRTAAIAAALGVAYGAAGYLIHKNDYNAGYNVATLASVGLIATSGPAAWAAKDAYHVALGSLGAISLATNTLKIYQLRTGLPRDLEVRRQK